MLRHFFEFFWASWWEICKQDVKTAFSVIYSEFPKIKDRRLSEYRHKVKIFIDKFSQNEYDEIGYFWEK